VGAGFATAGAAARCTAGFATTGGGTAGFGTDAAAGGNGSETGCSGRAGANGGDVTVLGGCGVCQSGCRRMTAPGYISRIRCGCCACGCIDGSGACGRIGGRPWYPPTSATAAAAAAWRCRIALAASTARWLSTAATAALVAGGTWYPDGAVAGCGASCTTGRGYMMKPDACAAAGVRAGA
jgi:hypothetical protein